MQINCCSKACVECGFTIDGTTNTLYAETMDIIKNGVVFPCHMVLREHSGNESYGAETLKDVKVCRGYVAFIKKYFQDNPSFDKLQFNTPVWTELLNQIDNSELDNIRNIKELLFAHKQTIGTYLGNTIRKEVSNGN